jgi:hypothetical protein
VLIWDENYITSREQHLGERVSVSIANERFDWKRKLLRRADRKIDSKTSTGEPRFVNETLHPIFDNLFGKEFWVRSMWRRYAPNHVPSDTPRFSSSVRFAELIQIACERGFENTKR